MRSFTNILFYLCIMLTVVSSCNSTKTMSNTGYETNITAHRQKTEKGLTEGPRAPITKDDLKNIRYFDLNQDYKVVADVKLSDGEKPFELPTYSGITKTYIKYATATFKLNDNEVSLNLYRNLEVIRMPQYKNYLFLPFKDMTNGKETYGGGRYMNLSTEDIADGKIELDFNKTYNPWCAYSDGYNCPIPPFENHMKISIHAGEKNYAGK